MVPEDRSLGDDMTGSDASWEEFERKDRRRAALAKKLMAIGAIPVVDWFFETRFSRDFSGVTPLAQTKPYLLPQEVCDADEADIIEKLVASFADDTAQELDARAALAPDGSLNYRFIDPHWGHTTGNLHGTLSLEDDLSMLHEDLRAGLYAAGGSYPVFARPNFLDDGKGLPIAINRLSLKLKMPQGYTNALGEDSDTLDLLMSEGLAPTDVTQPDGQGFFFRDARQLLMANEAKNGGFDAIRVLLDSEDAQTLTFWKDGIFKQATDMLYRGAQTHLSWDQKYYYSAGPYALGPGAMKFALEPVAQTPGAHIHPLKHPYARHFEAAEDLRENQREVAFNLMVQVATEEAIRAPQAGDPSKDVMAAEYTDLAWNTDVAPFQKVGTLTLHAHDVAPNDATTHWYALPFSAWNTYPDNRPLGQLFRARKIVHGSHRNVRLSHSFGAKQPFPYPGKCPFRA